MLKFRYIIFLMSLFIVSSCKKDGSDVEQVNESIVTTLDTHLYPGNFKDYEVPTFEQNTNTQRNALIEEFTGHLCGHCPRAHEAAADLENTYPNQVFSTAIHAGPDWDGKTVLQATMEEMYTRDFTTTEGKELAAAFYQLGVGFNAVPKGTVSRNRVDGNFVLNYSQWEEQVETVLNTELLINLQAKSNYFPSTNGLFLHVESEFLDAMNGDYNMTAYLVQKEIVDWQRDYLYSPDSDLPSYKHKNVHLGTVSGEIWGKDIASGSIPKGTKTVTNFSLKLPETAEIDQMHCLIYVYDRETYEILQVIKHEI